MRVIQLITARQHRGAEIFASQLSHEIQSSGADVLYVALYAPPPNEFIPKGLTIVDLNGSKSGVFSFRLLKDLCAIIRKFKPDLLQANAGDTMKYAVAVRFLWRLRFKIVFRNASTISAYLKNPVKRRLQGFLLRQIDLVLSVSATSAADMIGLYPFLSRKVRVIPVSFSPGGDNAAHVDPGLFKDKPTIIHVGGFTFEKNHEGLIRIFTKFLARYHGARLLLVGDGPLRSGIEKLVNGERLTSSVTFLGTRTDVMELLRRSDCLVLPSIVEGLPAVLLEAGWAETPMVAYDTGGISEVVIDGVTGWIVRKNDEAAFANAMAEAVGDGTEAKRRTANARQRIAVHYNMKKIAAEFLTAYRTLLSE